MDRRGFLRATARLAALAALGQLGACTQSRPLKFDRDPFTLGVASGCPRPDGVVLWTRLAPDPLQVDAMDPVPMGVEWRIAEDEAFARTVAQGTETAVPSAAHSVHVEVKGLKTGCDYWYQFA